MTPTALPPSSKEVQTPDTPGLHRPGSQPGKPSKRSLAVQHSAAGIPRAVTSGVGDFGI